MSENPVLIAGATGATGGAAANLLLERGHAVRALVHSIDARSNALAERGAEVFEADLLDLRDVRKAFEGVKRAYFVYPILPTLVHATAIYAQAAKEAGAEFIVNLSQRTAREDAISNSALDHWLAERVFDWAGTPVTHLRPVMFNEWLLYMHKGIKAGHYRVPFGTTGKFSPISTKDQGAVIAEVLANPEPHVGKTHYLLGPEEMTAPQIAETVSRVLGRPVRYEQITGTQWVEAVFGPDVPYGNQHVEGIAVMQELGQMAGTNDVVEQITGRKAETVAEFVERNRAAWD